MTTATVKVLLNMDSRFFEYEPGQRLLLAAVFELGFPACGSVERLLDIVYHQLNIPEPQVDWAVAYRTGRNRSLSVGDVITIGEAAYAVQRFGFKPVTVGERQVWTDLGKVQ